MSSYDIWMIKMTYHPISEMYYRTVAPSWKKFGYKLKKFEAVTPKDLSYKNKLTFGIKDSIKGKREFTPTEKAVWYSHFELWCKCLNTKKPLIIIEHDSKLLKPLPDLSNEGYKFLSRINRDWKSKPVIDMAPGSGYYITPIVAERLISNAVSKKITINSDGHLVEYMNFKRQLKMDDYHYIEQISIDGLNTIDHKAPYKNYVGLNYEEIDIPSLHGQEI